MRIYCLLILFFILFCPIREVKSQDCTGCHFAAVTFFVQNDPTLESKIKSLFPKLTRRNGAIQFRVDTRVEYIPLYSSFGGSIASTLLDSLTGRSRDLPPSEYDKRARFESYDHPQLAGLSTDQDASLTLRFSSCNSGYVVAELLDGRMNFGQTRYGKVLHLLIFFENHGFIDRVLTSSYTYN